MRETERGVSDMIAFVIIFSLIITSVGITYTFGFSTLSDYQEEEQKRNGERAFIALSHNLGDIEGDQVPGRSGELRLSGGTISVEEDTTINVSTGDWSRSFRTTGALTYRYEGTSIEYENGAVFRGDGDGSRVMLSEPDMQCSDSHAAVSVVTLRHDGGAFSSDGTVQVIGELQSRYLWYPENRTGGNDVTSVDHVNVTIESNGTDGWESYFRDEDGWTHVSSSDNEITFQCGAGSGNIDLYVRQSLIQIEFIT
jgi:hypothetical protein